ncbi:MAG TPA: PaaI family thioesterase [Acidimicrobiia bacterium]|nr:PaaI family thioesterase [Acidimicrobiia bacterium]
MKDDPMKVSGARIEAAEALRRLGNALVGHHVEDDYLHEMAKIADGMLREVIAGERRERPVDNMKRYVWGLSPGEGDRIDHFPDCIVSGAANPMGLGMSLWRDGDEALARVRLGHAFEGAPGRAHGGIVASIFDDVMGIVLTIHSTPAFTARLTVSYLAPAPIGVELEFRARLTSREGRKLCMAAEATHKGTLIAEAEGVFIALPPERFGLPPAPEEVRAEAGESPGASL